MSSFMGTLQSLTTLLGIFDIYYDDIATVFATPFSTKIIRARPESLHSSRYFRKSSRLNFLAGAMPPTASNSVLSLITNLCSVSFLISVAFSQSSGFLKQSKDPEIINLSSSILQAQAVDVIQSLGSPLNLEIRVDTYFPSSL